MQFIKSGTDYDIAKYYLERFPDTTQDTPVREISINLSEHIVRTVMLEISRLNQLARTAGDPILQGFYQEDVARLYELSVALKSFSRKQSIISEIKSIC